MEYDYYYYYLDATKAQVFPPIAGFTFSTWLCFDKMGVYCVADANSLASRHRDYDSCYKSGRCIMCGGVINVMKELPCGHVGCARCVKERQKAGGRCVTCAYLFIMLNYLVLT